MQAVSDQAIITKKVRSSKVMLGLGVALMAVAVAGPLVTSYLPTSFQYLIIAFYVVLFAGLILFNSGIYELRKWRASPRGDEVLYRELRGLRDQFMLFNFVELPGGVLLEHVISGPGGITIVEAREQEGEFEFDGRQWRQRMGVLRRIFGSGQRALGNPFADLSKRLEAFRAWLQAHELSCPVHGTVVFTSPKARLVRVDSPPYPVTTPKGLRGMLQRSKGSALPAETQARLQELLRQCMANPVEVIPERQAKKAAKV